MKRWAAVPRSLASSLLIFSVHFIYLGLGAQAADSTHHFGEGIGERTGGALSTGTSKDLPSSFHRQLRVLTAAEIQAVQRRLGDDPIASATLSAIAVRVRSGPQAHGASASPLAQALRDPNSGETRLVLEYLRWIAHRSKKTHGD